MRLQRKLIDVGLGAVHLKNAKAPSSIFEWKCSWESCYTSNFRRVPNKEILHDRYFMLK